MIGVYRLLPGSFFSVAMLFLAGMVLSVSVVSAQERIRIENEFSSVIVTKEKQSARFWFATGAQHGYTRYTFNGGGAAASITSNVVFRLKHGSGYNYYCNTVDPTGNGGERPLGANGGEVPFAPYDSIYVSPGNDTCAVVWKNLDGFRITMRFVAEAPRNEFDDGADILLEFDYKQSLGGVQPAESLEIFLMLDGDNGTIRNGIASDQVSALTDRGYYPANEFGGLFQKEFGGIPEYYLIGWFEYTDPLNDIIPIHRLSGTSLGGALLTTPEMFAIGDWRDFRSLAWNVNSNVNSKQVGDVATCMRWSGLSFEGTVRTAFGTTSRLGNNLFHCRDSNIFVAMRTKRLVEQEGVNGPYNPDKFEVEMWVTSLRRRETISPYLELRTPIQSYPNGDRRLRLDPSTSKGVRLDLRPLETKKHTWIVDINQAAQDSIVDLQILYRDSAMIDTKPLVPLLAGCSPRITFRSAYIPPMPDERPPVVEATGSGRTNTAWWTFRTYDRHPGYTRNTGLDRIEVLRNDNNNFRLITTPDPFVRCDTNVTVNVRAEVVDTSKGGTIVFRVYDCEGNWTEKGASYSSRPDIFKPEVNRIDSIDRYDPINYPCATPVFEVYLEDRNNQTASAGDAGFGSVEVLTSTNFQPIEINFDQGDVGIEPFDETATFRLQIIDKLLPASAQVRIADFAGNADTLYFDYCTLPDTLPPLVNVTPQSGGLVTSWTVDATDERDWDRGLAEVVEISNTNMNITPWPVGIVAGQASVNGIAVKVIDDARDAEIILEFRDTYYDQNDPSTHVNHSERVEWKFTGIADTMAPNIVFVRDLTVPVDEIVYTVAVNDTHYVAGEFYEYDRGLESVVWSLTPNMNLRTPIVYTDNRRGATFQVEIVDPLAIVEGDTVCVTAVDSAGNITENCQVWPNVPDGKSPYFKGRLDVNRLSITGTASDDREYDRGLGRVELRNPVNLEPYSRPGLAGLSTESVSIDVLDPELPIAGELVVRDLVGELDDSPEQSIHTVIIPFSLQTVALEIMLPELVEGGEEILTQIIAANDFDADQVQRLDFAVQFSDNGQFVDGMPGPAMQSLNVMPTGTQGVMTVSAITEPGQSYQRGDVIGTIRFQTELPYFVEMFRFSVASETLRANSGEERTIVVQTDGDPVASELTLPAPFFRIAADSQTVINGECNRALTSDQALARTSGLAILGVYPQPVGSGAGEELRVFVRDIPQEGSALELIRLDGTPALQRRLEASADGRVAEYGLDLPAELERGVYFLRITGSTGADQVKVLVVE